MVMNCNIIQSYIRVPTYLGIRVRARVFKQPFSFSDADQEHGVKLLWFLSWSTRVKWYYRINCKYSSKIQIIDTHTSNLIRVALVICSFALDFRVRVSPHCIIIMSIIEHVLDTTCSHLQFYSSGKINELERKITSYRYITVHV